MYLQVSNNNLASTTLAFFREAVETGRSSFIAGKSVHNQRQVFIYLFLISRIHHSKIYTVVAPSVKFIIKVSSCSCTVLSRRRLLVIFFVVCHFCWYVLTNHICFKQNRTVVERCIHRRHQPLLPCPAPARRGGPSRSVQQPTHLLLPLCLNSPHQQYLNIFRDGWDYHPLSTEGNLSPNQLWYLGQQHHSQECDDQVGLCTVQILELLDILFST